MIRFSKRNTDGGPTAALRATYPLPHAPFARTAHRAPIHERKGRPWPTRLSKPRAPPTTPLPRARWAGAPPSGMRATPRCPATRSSSSSCSGASTAASSCGPTRKKPSWTSCWATTSSWAPPRARASRWLPSACTSSPCARAGSRTTPPPSKPWSARSSSTCATSSARRTSA